MERETNEEKSQANKKMLKNQKKTFKSMLYVEDATEEKIEQSIENFCEASGIPRKNITDIQTKIDSSLGFTDATVTVSYHE